MVSQLNSLSVLAVNGEEIAAMAIIGSLGIACVSIIGGIVSRVVRARAFEASRREISAYVAEGSISADDAAKLLSVGKSPGSSCGDIT